MQFGAAQPGAATLRAVPSPRGPRDCAHMPVATLASRLLRMFVFAVFRRLPDGGLADGGLAI